MTNKACEDNAGGGHWQREAGGAVDRTNELWAGGEWNNEPINDNATPISGFVIFVMIMIVF